MSFYASAVVSTNVLGVWDGYLMWRQRKTYCHTNVPVMFQPVISAEEFAKNQAYCREKATFSLLEHARDLVLGNISLLWRVPAKIYKAAATITGLAPGSFLHCFTFSVTEDIIATLLDLPFSYYETFCLEEKHGFNKTTKRDFVLDAIKSFGLRVALLHPIQTGLIQWVVQKFGEKFPMYFFIAASVLAVAFTVIYPTLIQPLFNTFTPLGEESSLYGKIGALAQKVGFPLKKVFTVDGSRRSSHSNAYMYGFGKNKRVVLYDTLIEQLGKDEEQILAVLSHEFGHWRYGHTYAMLSVGLGQLLAMSYGAKAVIFNEDMYRQFGFRTVDPVIGFDLFCRVFVEPLSTFLGYGMNYLSRTFEFQADRFAVSLGYGSKLRDALCVMVKENKSGLTPDPLYSALTYSHPPMIERVAAIEACDADRKKKRA